MVKEWILNMATNRWGLNKKNSVGPVSEWIRQCNPKEIEDWEKFYYQKLAGTLREKGISLNPEDYLNDLGRKLFVKTTEVIQLEIEEVTEEDCIQYIKHLLLVRTFDGYMTKIKTVYEELKQKLGENILPAPDDWDRLFNVDFYIPVADKNIGLQIKPITYEQTPEIYRWKEWLRKTHEMFCLKRNRVEKYLLFSQ